MSILKDLDFRIALGISSLVLGHLVLSLIANILAYNSLSRLTPNAKPIDFGFVLTESVVFLISLSVLYGAIKIAKMRGIGMKIGLGFSYSLISTFFVVYKFVFESFYHIQLGGGDWGYLAVVLGWPLFFIVSIPLLIIFLKTFSTSSNTTSRAYSFIMLIPTICGMILLTLLTFTGRAIYQPIYDKRKLQIEEKLIIKPIKFQFLGSNYDPQCKCTRPAVSGVIDISNNLTFPVVLDLRTSSSQSICKINSKYSYLLAFGNEQIGFECSFNESESIDVKDMSKIIYTLRVEEKENSGVRLEKSYSIRDFVEVLNF